MYVWVKHSPHYSWCDVSDVSGTSSFKRSERSKKHQLLFITAREGRSQTHPPPTVAVIRTDCACLSHAYTHKPISSILFLYFRLSALPSSHSPISFSFLSFFLFHSLSRAHSLSFFLTHTLHTA